MLPAQVSYWQLQETKRHNQAMESIDYFNAEQNARNASTNERNAVTNARNAEINAWNASINERSLPAKNLQALGSIMQGQAALEQAGTAADQYNLAVEKWDYLGGSELYKNMTSGSKDEALGNYYRTQSEYISGPQTEKTEAETGEVGQRTQKEGAETELRRQESEYQKKKNKSYWIDELFNWWGQGTRGYSDLEKGQYYDSKANQSQSSENQNPNWFFDAFDAIFEKEN